MKDIDGFEELVETFRPHWPEFLAWFDAENERFKAFIGQGHDLMGRVLKCHLIVEHYLGLFLTQHYKLDDLENAKLGFFQKAQLLPSEGHSVSFVKPGILKLNAIRNRFGHTLDPKLTEGDLEDLQRVLRVFRAGAKFSDPISVIEAFTVAACTALLITPQPLAKVFEEAFSNIPTRLANP